MGYWESTCSKRRWDIGKVPALYGKRGILGKAANDIHQYFEGTGLNVHRILDEALPNTIILVKACFLVELDA